jgi:hypothetical protein
MSLLKLYGNAKRRKAGKKARFSSSKATSSWMLLATKPTIRVPPSDLIVSSRNLSVELKRDSKYFESNPFAAEVKITLA